MNLCAFNKSIDIVLILYVVEVCQTFARIDIIFPLKFNKEMNIRTIEIHRKHEVDKIGS